MNVEHGISIANQMLKGLLLNPEKQRGKCQSYYFIIPRKCKRWGGRPELSGEECGDAYRDL